MTLYENRREIPLILLTLVVVLGGIGLPLCASHYPLMVDFPYHVNQTSMLRHYNDPQFHFYEQVRLQPLFSYANYAYAYFSAALAFLFNPLVATKIGAYLFLLFIPAGMWLTLRTMGKSPYWVLAAPPFVWGYMAHLGFINFLSALGLCLASVGLTARLSDRPTVSRFINLALLSLLIYLTHLAAVPVAIATTFIVGLFCPKSRKFIIYWLLVIIFFSCLLLFWNRVSAPGPLHTVPMAFDLSRIASFHERFFFKFSNNAEIFSRRPLIAVIAILGCVNLICFLLRFWREGFSALPKTPFLRWSLAALCLGSFLLYLYLPMRVEHWWGIYFRMGFMMVFFALLLLPDFPINAALRYATVIGLGLASLLYMHSLSQVHAEFDQREYGHFRAIMQKIPEAPKLYYESTTQAEYLNTKDIFQHFHEYVQAERGGWINKGLIGIPRSPIGYRDRNEPGAVVPPRPASVTDPFFEWYLVRSYQKPVALFKDGPDVREVANEGMWWLYERIPGGKKT